MNNGQLFPPRLLVALYGDMSHNPESNIKYGTFIEALKRTFPVAGIYNAKLHGLYRLINAISVWHPDPKKWNARVNKNANSFILRSWQATRWTNTFRGRADLILQVGVLFDAGWDDHPLPRIIYTDYTASMSARRPAAGRSPFRGAALERWLALERDALQSAAHVCVNSEIVKISLIQDYDLSSEKITVVGGGLNLRRLPDLPALPMDRVPTALFIGTDFYRKGGDLVLNAFAIVRAVIPDAQLIFVSQDPIPSTCPRDGVRILAPIWNREQFLELYSQADVLVLPSRLETWGDVLLEAMAFGLPCIGVTGQPMQEIIRNGETGLLAPPEQVDALADALIHLLNQPQLCRKMGEAGRNLVAHEYTWDRVVDRIAFVAQKTFESYGQRADGVRAVSSNK